MPDTVPYRGRFAPSPTGPLHFGSLLAATASYLEARAHHGEWLLRMEDIDEPRNVAGSDGAILRTLEAFGFKWHGEVLYQTQRKSAYAEILQQLQQQNLTYRCTCSRSELQANHTSNIYPGRCADKQHAEECEHAVRLRIENRDIEFNDAVMGVFAQNLQTDVGDFIIRRRDGLFAYQLAVVVDDEYQGITHVVRGADLLDSTPRQIYLQQCLQFNTPHYTHLPLAVNAREEKLSKQTYAQEIRPNSNALIAALNFLGQATPEELRYEPISEIWKWAIPNWHVEKISKNNQLPLEHYSSDR